MNSHLLQRWRLTVPFSWHLVSITMTGTLCSHTILQKSARVFSRGPCVAMKAFR